MQGLVKVAVEWGQWLALSWRLNLHKVLRLIQLSNDNEDLSGIEDREIMVVTLVVDDVDLTLVLRKGFCHRFFLVNQNIWYIIDLKIKC